MAEIIAIVNQKGGVAKTTTTIHLGVALAQLGKKILLVDLDSQGHLAEGFGIVADNIEREMSDVFEGSKGIKDVIMPNVRQNLDLAPSNVRLADMELTLVNMRFRESKLKRALEPVVSRYDYILLSRFMREGWRAWSKPPSGHRIWMRPLNPAVSGDHARQG